jgi:hypothetical protein
MNGQIIEYKILSASGHPAMSELAHEVNKAIAEGWELMGGVGGGKDNDLYTSLFQAMVRRESNPNSNEDTTPFLFLLPRAAEACKNYVPFASVSA